jgi:hypothetical protein
MLNTIGIKKAFRKSVGFCSISWDRTNGTTVFRAFSYLIFIANEINALIDQEFQGHPDRQEFVL